MSWKNKKQSVVSRSSEESEYMAMTNMALELIWIKDLLIAMVFSQSVP